MNIFDSAQLKKLFRGGGGASSLWKLSLFSINSVHEFRSQALVGILDTNSIVPLDK